MYQNQNEEVFSFFWNGNESVSNVCAFCFYILLLWNVNVSKEIIEKS